MWRRVCALVVLAGCWSDDPPVNGFTAEQWAKLHDELTVHPVNPCVLPAESPSTARCDALAAFGEQLFFDPALSGNGLVSCGTCHDKRKDKYFIDTRAQNNVSFGVPTMTTTGWTKRNAMATVDLALKYNLEKTKAFIWSGKAKTPGGVLEVAISGPPFQTTDPAVATVIRNKYSMQYQPLFGTPTPDDGTVLHNAETALDAYMFQITSLDSPFDAWLAGNDDAIPDSAKRGFQVFAGRGLCITCHSGPAFSDFDYHDTGVPETGSDTPGKDLGRADVTKLVEDEGKFMTPTLRNLARTGPYMHDGVFQSLPEVVDFYRRGGGDGMYSGVKDPQIMPLDLTDEDANDLIAFLQSLNGVTLSQYDSGMGSGSGSGSDALCGPFTDCNGACFNTQTDPTHCGSCTNACMPTDSCVMGTCAPNPCPPGWGQCGPGMCFDFMNDPLNCGSCGHMCPTYCMAGQCG